MAERKNFDSEFCGNLPLHHVNLIQDYGYLLVIDPDALNLIQASENVVEITGKPVQELIGKNIADYIDNKDLHKIKDSLASGIRQKIPFDITIKGDKSTVQFHALMHIKEGYTLIELEKAGKSGQASFTRVFQ